jgi:hypothetical protein
MVFTNGRLTSVANQFGNGQLPIAVTASAP